MGVDLDVTLNTCKVKRPWPSTWGWLSACMCGSKEVLRTTLSLMQANGGMS